MQKQETYELLGHLSVIKWRYLPQLQNISYFGSEYVKSILIFHKKEK